VDDDIPLNEGCLENPFERDSTHSMLSPEIFRLPSSPGNVETSQAITTACMARLGVMAAAQGHHEQLTFGNAPSPYLRNNLWRGWRGPD